MDFDQAIAAIQTFEGRPVAVDSTVTRPAQEMPEEHRECSEAGVLQRREFPRSGDKAVDDAAWWHRQKGKVVIGIEPASGFLISRERFQSADWHGDSLVLELSAFKHRISALVRGDGKPLG